MRGEVSHAAHAADLRLLLALGEHSPPDRQLDALPIALRREEASSRAHMGGGGGRRSGHMTARLLCLALLPCGIQVARSQGRWPTTGRGEGEPSGGERNPSLPDNETSGGPMQVRNRTRGALGDGWFGGDNTPDAMPPGCVSPVDEDYSHVVAPFLVDDYHLDCCLAPNNTKCKGPTSMHGGVPLNSEIHPKCFPRTSRIPVLAAQAGCTTVWCASGSGDDYLRIKCDNGQPPHGPDSSGWQNYAVLLFVWFCLLGLCTCFQKVRQCLRKSLKRIMEQPGLDSEGLLPGGEEKFSNDDIEMVNTAIPAVEVQAVAAVAVDDVPALPAQALPEPKPEPEPEPEPELTPDQQEAANAAAFAGFRSARTSEIQDVDEIKFEMYLSKGTSGTVSKAHWRGMDVAVKQFYYVEDSRERGKLAGGGARGSETLESFENEVFLMKNLDHANLVRFFGAQCKPPSLCIVMELMRGSLADLLYGKLSKGVDQSLTPARQLSVLKDIVAGMTFLHSHSVIHRDLKSANCLFNRQLVVKICDFAFSKFRLGGGAGGATSAAFETSVGTPAWMAPEVLRGDEYRLHSIILLSTDHFVYWHPALY